MYKKAVAEIIAKFKALPKVLIRRYLMKTYPNVTRKMADDSIYAACRAKLCYDAGVFVANTAEFSPSNIDLRRMREFRVLLEFLPDSKEYYESSYPWEFSFVTKRGNLVQICYIAAGMETQMSMAIASKKVDAAEREFTYRIAVLDPSCSIEKVKKVGFRYICVVDNEFELLPPMKIEEEEAWADA